MRLEMRGVFQGVSQVNESQLFAVLLLNDGPIDVETAKALLEKKVRITVEDV